MRSNLPQLQLNPPRQPPHKHPTLTKLPPTPKINIKGITLKDYFLMCQQAELASHSYNQRNSSRDSLPETPTFHHPTQAKKQIRIKIKTDADEEADFNGRPSSKFQDPATTRSNNILQCAISDKGSKVFFFGDLNSYRKKEARKKIKTHLYCSTNRSQDLQMRLDYRIDYLHKLNKERQQVYDGKGEKAFSLSKYNSKLYLQAKSLKTRT